MMVVMLLLLLLLLVLQGSLIIVCRFAIVSNSCGCRSIAKQPGTIFRRVATIIIGDKLPRAIPTTGRDYGLLYCSRCRFRGGCFAVRRHGQPYINGFATIVRNYYRFAYRFVNCRHYSGNILEKNNRWTINCCYGLTIRLRVRLLIILGSLYNSPLCQWRRRNNSLTSLVILPWPSRSYKVKENCSGCGFLPSSRDTSQVNS